MDFIRGQNTPYFSRDFDFKIRYLSRNGPQFIKVNFKVEVERSLSVFHFCFSNEIEATLNRLKKLEKDLTVKEKELREV